LTFEFIVLSQSIVDDVSEIDEDRVESDLACDGTLFLTQ